MKTQSVALFVLVLLSIVWLTQLAKSILKNLENKEAERLQKLRQDAYTLANANVRNQDFKQVLNKENCDSSSKPKRPEDFNENQNLNTKYSPNVYRDKHGRFKSKKAWSKEQKNS